MEEEEVKIEENAQVEPIKKVIEIETVQKVVEQKTTKKLKKEEPIVESKIVTVQFLSGSANAGMTKKMLTVLAKKLEASGKLKIIKNV